MQITRQLQANVTQRPICSSRNSRRLKSAPARSKEASTPSFVCNSVVRMTYAQAARGVQPLGHDEYVDGHALISSEPSSPAPPGASPCCASALYKRLRSLRK